MDYELYTAAELRKAAAYDEARRVYNVCALGDGENWCDLWSEINGKRARNAANAVQIAEWNKTLPDTGILTCDGVVMCSDCPMRGTVDCEEYQKRLTECGRGNDFASWNEQTAEMAGAFSPRCD